MIKERWSDSTGSYIRLSGDDKERMCDSILSGKCVEGILPLDIEYVNGSREYVYETSGYRVMSELLEDNPLSKEQWVKLLSDIVKIGCELEEYLLSMEHMLITPDTVFIRPDDMRVGCIFCAEHNSSMAEKLNRLCEQALKFPEYDRDQAEFLYRLHSATIGENITVNMIREFLTKEGGENEEKNKPENDESSQVGRFIYGTVEKARTNGKNKRIENEKSVSKNGKESEVKTGVKQSYAFSVGMVLAGILVPTICLYLGVFSSQVSGSINITKTVGAYAFFIIVSLYGAYRLLSKKDHVLVWEEEEDLSICLLPQSAGLSAMPVSILPWKIGRDERQVDAVIDREGISPIHAKIEKESASVFVTDEESKEGTLLNRNRLVPWEKTRIKDGDILSFGGTSYVVEITV